MRFIGRNILVFIFVFYSSDICQPDQINFKNISIEQGLSQSTVYSIVQDSIGFMWFATRDGLNKYDGYNFTIYRPNPLNPESISATGIRRLLVDSRGYLWIITLTGEVNRYDYKRDIFKNYLLDTAIRPINQNPLARCVVEDISGNIWVGTVAGILYRFDWEKNGFIKKDIILNKKNNSQDIHLQSMHADNSGLIWIGTWEGLISYDCTNGKIAKYKHNPSNPNSLGGNAVFDIAEDKEGNLWIASANGGVSVFDKKRSSFKVFQNNLKNLNSISSNRVFCIYPDLKSNVWIGTADAGLDLYDHTKKVFKNYRSGSSLQSSLNLGSIMCFFEDRSGALWIGTANDGAKRIDMRQQNFFNISHIANDPDGLKISTVLALCEDHLGTLWVGTDGGGLNKRLAGKKEFEHYNHLSPKIISNTITAIFEDHKGTIWIGADPGFGTSAGKVITYNREQNIFKTQQEVSPVVAGIGVFFEDARGELWIGTSFDGVRRLDSLRENVTVYKHKNNNSNTICEDRITDICEDKNGSIWIGTYNKGLNKYNPFSDKFTYYQNNPHDTNSLSNNAIQCILTDNSGYLWIGTRGGGLNKFLPDKKSFRRFTINDGLAGNVIAGILDDGIGHIWLSTNNGLSRFNKKTYVCKNFDHSDGLQSGEFIQGSYFKASDGKLYFGGTKGITEFFPYNITDNPNPPQIVLTKFSVFNKSMKLKKPINLTRDITLSYKQNFFSFEFAALDYTAPGKNQYAYMLDDVDAGWIYTGNRRYASYTDISPGKYTFRVKGSNNDGVWSKQEAFINIIITPPFWQTWWFRTLSLIFLAFILFALHKYRLNKLLEVERTRLRIARDLHDDVSATITGMVYFSDAIDKEVGDAKTPMLQKLITLIRESAFSVQESMSDIIWSINPENDKWEIILPKFRRFASDLCESKGINYNIEIPEVISVKPLDMERRRNLWLVFKEIVTNAVKHSECNELKISITFQENKLKLIVSDNGKGFDVKKNTEGNGVKNIQTRSKALNGHIDLISLIDKGTEWKILIPV